MSTLQSEERTYGKMAAAVRFVLSAAEAEAEVIEDELAAGDIDPAASIDIYEGAFMTAGHALDLMGRTPEKLSASDMRDIKLRNRVEETWVSDERMMTLAGCFLSVLYTEEVRHLVGGGKVEESDLLDFEPHFE